MRRGSKPTFTKPAPADLRREIAEHCDAVIEALADGGSCVSCGLRDVMEIEALGTPAVLAASTAFVQAADEQTVLLGQPELRRVHVGHPIQNRTDEEMRALARTTVDELLAAVSA